MGLNLCFAIVNQATVDPGYGLPTEAILQNLASCLADWMNADVAPIWGGTFEGRVAKPDASDIGAGEAPVYLVDNLNNVPGAAAYHDRQPDGSPIIYVSLAEFSSWFDSNGVASGCGHEYAEVNGDLPANKWSDRVDGTEEAEETCDRAQGTDYQFDDGQGNVITVPNFLYPSAFDPGSRGPYDHQGVLTSVTDQTPGGYVILRQQGPAVNGVPQKKVRVVGDPRIVGHKLARKCHHSSRTYRRGVRLLPPEACKALYHELGLHAAYEGLAK